MPQPEDPTNAILKVAGIYMLKFWSTVRFLEGYLKQTSTKSIAPVLTYCDKDLWASLTSKVLFSSTILKITDADYLALATEGMFDIASPVPIAAENTT